MDEQESYDGPVPPPWDEPEQQPDETPPSSRSLKPVWASTIPPAPVVWAWQDADGGRIPAGSLSIAAGREGTGKSSFGIWMAAQVTQGALPGAYEGKPRTVFYLAVEDSWKHTLVPRLLAAGADLTKVARVDVVSVEDDDYGTINLPRDNRALEDLIAEHDVALVVMDPIMSLISDRIDTHREREVRSALDPLAKIADRTGSVFLGIAHFNKGGGTDTASLITGSGAFKNVPRTIFGFAKDDSEGSNERVMTQVKNSLGRDDLPSFSYMIESVEIPTALGPAVTGRFTFLGESSRSVADVLRDSRGDDEDRTELGEASEWLRDYVTSQGGSCTAKDAYKAANAMGFSNTTLKRARKAAGVKTTKAGMSGGWFWTIEESTTFPKGPKSSGFRLLDPSVNSSAEPPREGSTKGSRPLGLGPLDSSVPSDSSGNPTCIRHGIPFVDGACLACTTGVVS